MRVAPSITVTPQERTILERWSRGRSTPARLVLRARIVLAAASGQQNKDIAAALPTTRKTVGEWRARFAESRLAGIETDAPRGGRPPSGRDADAARIIEATTQTKPENATHWSTRTLAAKLGVSPSMVQRVWRASGLKPHLVKTFKVSNDPHFAAKVVDVVGLYLPLYPGRLQTMTHDYKRHGTTTLFAAIDLAQGKLIAECQPRHRHQEWLKFLKKIDAETPPGLDLHLIVDNYATHKHPEVKRWLGRHRRFHVHFIPTSSSWLNVIERWFRDLTAKRVRRGVFRSVPELIEAIMEFVAHHNANPKSFEWTAKADAILEKVRRARAVLDKTRSG